MSVRPEAGGLAGLAIVLPVLNEAGGIEAALTALQPWRERGAAVLVVDGGSHDDTLRLAAPSADIVLASLPGRGVQMNAGARATVARLLLFLHADTALPAAAAQAMAELLEEGTPCWGRFDVRIEGRHWLLPVVAQLMNLRSAITGVATGDQAMFVTRDLFEQVGGFREIPLMEDVELSKALRALCWPRRQRLRVVTSGRRWEQHGTVRTICLMWALRLLHWVGVNAGHLSRWYRAVR